MLTLEDNLTQSLKGNLNNLSKNMMFRLSLTSKELFHSNFWAWLLEEYPSAVNVFCETSDNFILTEISREKNHTDLSFKLNGQLVIVENKFKSFPDLNQLKKYAENKNNLDRVILVSFYKPLFLNQNNDINFKFEYISYEVLCKRLKEFVKDLPENNNKTFIQDYIQMLNLLLEFKNILSFKNNPEKTYGDFLKTFDEIFNEAKKINFEVVLQKIFFHQFLIDLLEDTKYSTAFKAVDYASRARSVYMDIMLKVEEKNESVIKLIGIEISRNQYRKYIQANKQNDQDRTLLEKSIELNPQYSWFYQNCIGRNKHDNTGFWGYNYPTDAWLYKVCCDYDISEMNFLELKHSIIKELENIEKNISVES